MDRKKKIGLAVLIVGVGVGVALEFRKPEAATTFAEQAEPTRPIATSSAGMSPGGGAAGPASAFDGRIEAVADAKASQSASDGGLNDGGTIAPPVRSSEMQRFAVGGASGIGDAAPSGNDSTSLQPLVDLNAPDRIHKIADGDTLTALAARYFGKTDRYLELYAYNRDVLSDPNVLPIGAELRIPSHIVVSTGSNPAAGDSAAGEAAANTTPVLPLSPLPTLPSAPLATQSVKKTGARTYKVQAGDNLVDIARKMYGDGRRHTDLFEANRRVLKTPYDLKPGMVLAVP